MREWIATELWDGNYFCPDKLPARLELYSSGVRYPLVTSLMDGCGVLAAWPSERGKTKTETLFNRLRSLIRKKGASWFYITDPDNVVSIFEWEEEIDPQFFNSYRLRVFETNPAAEGGDSHLGLAFHDREGVILFELGETFTVTCYGTGAFLEELRAVVGGT